MTSETRRQVWIVAGQVALVLLSVGLGLLLGEWRQSRADDERARLAVDGVVREMAANQSAVLAVADYRAGLIRGLQSGETTSVIVRSAPVVDNAWESTQAAGVVPDLPFPVVEALSQVHGAQQRYRETVRMVVGVLYLANVFESDRLPTDVSGYAPSLEDLQYTEGRMVELYGDAFRAIDAAGFAVPDSLLAR